MGGSVEEVLDDAHQILLSEYRDNVLPEAARLELARRLTWRRREARGCLVSPVDFLQAGLERAGIFDLFDVVASAEGEGRTKSDPQFSASVAFRLGANPANSWCVDDSAYALGAMAQAGFMTLGIYDSDNAGTKEDLREAADSLINGFEELDYECFVRGWKRESVAIR